MYQINVEPAVNGKLYFIEPNHLFETSHNDFFKIERVSEENVMRNSNSRNSFETFFLILFFFFYKETNRDNL